MNSALEAILGYLLEHSQASDTLQGVMWWWLLEESTVWPHAEVQAAIEDAVRRGLVLEVRGADGQIHYGLAPGKLPEICKLLRSDPGEQPEWRLKCK